jgi:hypothetical membrane protein
MARQALLLCGVFSSLLYGATDVLGGLRYPGYSFTSQAISELMASGAPSESIVDPLFIGYGVLALAFGAGVFRDAGGQNRALRITGALLVGYAALGFAGPTFFEMNQRGAGTSAGDALHIALTGALVLFLLAAVGSGAFALDRRFRAYSFATLSIVVVFGALTVPYAARLAQGQSTPGFGVLERIHVYAFMLWLAVLAVALLRRPWPTTRRSLL